MPTRILATGTLCRQATPENDPQLGKPAPGLLGIRVLDHALGCLLHGHGQVVLRARLDERRRKVLVGALTELLVVVVDLASPLGRDDDERVARVDVVQELIEAWVDHVGMVAAPSRARRTIPDSSSAARSTSSLTIR